jgi:hypothetical protein
MPANKYLALISGRRQEVRANDASAGAADAGKLVALDASGRLDASVMPTGVGPATVTITASEALSAGDVINVHDSTGPKVRKADATSVGKEAHGFVLAAVANAASATVYLSGTLSGLTGLTVGANYFLATTAGGVTATPPSAAGNVNQYIGRAVSTSAIDFDPDNLGEVIAA